MGQAYDLRVDDEWVNFGPEDMVVGRYVVTLFSPEAGGRLRSVELEKRHLRLGPRPYRLASELARALREYLPNLLSADGSIDRGAMRVAL